MVWILWYYQGETATKINPEDDCRMQTCRTRPTWKSRFYENPGTRGPIGRAEVAEKGGERTNLPGGGYFAPPGHIRSAQEAERSMAGSIPLSGVKLKDPRTLR